MEYVILGALTLVLVGTICVAARSDDHRRGAFRNMLSQFIVIVAIVAVVAVGAWMSTYGN